MTVTIHRGILKIGHRLFMPIYHGKTLLIEQKKYTNTYKWKN
jgi:hypothetical protein